MLRLATEQAGESLLHRQKGGQIAALASPVKWDFTLKATATPRRSSAGRLRGADPGAGGKKADHRMLYTATLYTPDKTQTHYLVDFDLDPVRGRPDARGAGAPGLGKANQLVAI
ncbi:MAG: hypothetical protein U0797_15500 [Gemmataceae bacterium]